MFDLRCGVFGSLDTYLIGNTFIRFDSVSLGMTFFRVINIICVEEPRLVYFFFCDSIICTLSRVLSKCKL